jgi:hypothetical protein
MIPESFARIESRGGKVGIHFVSEKRREFFVYDKQLLSMVSNPGKYHRVKHRNSQGKEAIGYPAGEVWGIFESYNGGSHAKVTICIGPNGENIELSDKKMPANLLSQYVFFLPMEDFTKLYGALALMSRQKDAFFDYLNGAEMEVALD